MYCCSNCFRDSEIKAIIQGHGMKKQKGNCDFCGSKKVVVYDIDKDDTLSEMFDGILDVYTPASLLPDSFPKEKTDLLKNLLWSHWNIFNVSSDVVYTLIKEICAERYNEQPELFDSPVGIIKSVDKDYLEENSILKNYQWDDFLYGIKRVNRFHSDYINKDVLLRFLSCTRKKHRAGKIFYRSRICHDENGLKPSEMGPPPVDKAKAGRVNPEGISILYVSDSKDTTLYEIRAGLYDYVSVGRFKLLKDIKVINLADIVNISPFIGDNAGFDFMQYAVNIQNLKRIGEEIAKPLRNDNSLDYLPTQYISDFIRSKGYDGIEYISTLRKNGVNLAVFDSKLFRCTKTETCDIRNIAYDYDTL